MYNMTPTTSSTINTPKRTISVAKEKGVSGGSDDSEVTVPGKEGDNNQILYSHAYLLI